MSFIDRIFPSTAPPAGADGALPDGAAAGQAPEGAARVCPECGTPAAPDQEWCLECGSRIEETSPRWHQPAAVMASVGLILIAGLALALSEVAQDAEVAKAKTVRKYVAAAPAPAAPVPASPTPDTPKSSGGISSTPKTSPNPTDTSSSAPSDSGSAATASPDTSGSSGSGSIDSGSTPTDSGSGGSSGGSTPTPAPAPTPVAEWPTGKKAYTVILLSTTSRNEAEALARKARAKGVPAGILQSSKYKSLSDGLWMVWAGRFGTEDAAYTAADQYSAAGFAGESVEYVREKGSESSGSGSSGGSGSTGSSGSGSDGTSGGSSTGKTTSTNTSPSTTTTTTSPTDTSGGEG